MKKIISVILVIVMTMMCLAVCASADEVGGGFTAVAGEWTYEGGKLTGGVADNRFSTAVTNQTVSKGEHVKISVDVKANAVWTEAGFGLYFDTEVPAPSDNPYTGMAVTTWTGSFGGQFKTWSWKLDKIATLWEGNPADVWAWAKDADGNDVVAYNDTSSEFTIIAEFNEDNTLTSTLVNKTTGKTTILTGGPLPLQNNTDKLYIGVLALNANVTFSNLNVERDQQEEPSATTGSHAIAAVSIAIAALSLAGAVICRKKKI